MKDLLLTPYKSVKLSHRIYFLKSKDGLYASCSRDGIVSLIDADFNILDIFDCSDIVKKKKDSIKLFNLHAFKDAFCIGSEYEFRVYDLSGKVLSTVSEKVEAVYSSAHNRTMWIVKRIDDEHKKICLTIDNTEMDSLIIEDKLYQSSVELSSLPDPDMVCMMFMAGQDGMATYFLTNDNGKIICEEKEELDDIAGMEFSDDNSKFLSVSAYDLDRVNCYAYPSLEIIREYELTEEQMEEEDCQLGYSSFFIDNTYSISEIGENLYYVLNTDNMEIEARLVVKGHEPKPIPFYWPSLKDDEGETTNLSYFHKTKDYLIAPYKLPEEKEDTSLVILKISDIKEQIEKVLS